MADTPKRANPGHFKPGNERAFKAGHKHARVGNGQLWGEGKGPRTDKPKQDFGEGANAQGHNGMTPAPFNRAEVRRQREDEVEAHMHKLALSAKLERDQIAAGKAFMVERKQLEGADGGPIRILYGWADDPEE